MNHDDLIAAAYDGAVATPPWASFMEGLRESVDADYCGIVFRPSDRPLEGPVELYSGRRAPPDVEALYLSSYRQIDPFQKVHLQLSDDRVYSLREMLRDDDPDHRRFLHDIMIPGRIDYMLLVRVTEASGTSAWLSISKQGSDFSPDARQQLASIARHFRGALHTHLLVERERRRVEIGNQAIRRFNAGWISLDANRRIVECSREAAQIMASSRELRISKAQQLIACDKSAHLRLADAVASVIANPESRPRAVNISRDPWLDALVTRATASGAGTDRRPLVVVFIQGDQKSAADQQEQIAELFGLLPSEARLAFALSRGMSIVEAAQALSITEATARNYSKKIYEKMGARGQTDLIRFILTSVLALA
ncbi:helix-turn-helix transcriptional regulator [Sphingomonas sp. C3-2]|uniref:helix-turn-helix transcriptional regulator n=1 Tax=Sphingomonas sp. C3-2 TaxID=3062169 RepID=UPI00294ACD8E|nr:helix-turn-helix transcriptional regulator [Sphingomonas sp. C3-2]WOK36442.1 helix-turn-helix transcriptional regulator [Sphingomonas sp. C3-2]